MLTYMHFIFFTFPGRIPVAECCILRGPQSQPRVFL